MKATADIRIFGVRHHGPGCARALLFALNEFQPDAVLLEGPPDGDEVLPLAADPQMQPPVALLIYPPDEPRRAVFYPFAVFSPEWQATQWALAAKVELLFCDLPITHRLAKATDGESTSESELESPPVEINPFDAMANAAGFPDSELWWDHLVEQRRDLTGVFEAIVTAVAELRSQAPEPIGVEAQREAFMRRSIRNAIKRKRERIAVVCGAWHAPALVDFAKSKADDDALLTGLSKTKVVATWIPWTYSRLSFRSGYGAGIDAPGWYEHLWLSPHRAAATWAAQAARLLREHDLDASSASVIETVRLADAVAAIRGRPSAGLLELRESIQTVLCHGESAPVTLIRQKLEIGDRLGQAPDSAPTVPLQRDLETQQKRLRLKPSTEIKSVDLDLRDQTARDKSTLLHRLAAMNIPWGTPEEVAGKLGTFHEIWTLRWQVEFAVSIVEASVWGNTVAAAATATIADASSRAPDLSKLAQLLDKAMLADLPDACEIVLDRLQSISALASDIVQLLETTAPLTRIIRYGDVRKTQSASVLPIFEGVVQRALVGLPVAGRGIDDDAAENLAKAIVGFRGNLLTLDRKDDLETLYQVMLRLIADDRLHALIRGLACRLLAEAGRMANAELLGRAYLELSPAVGPEQSGAWLEGLLGGGGTSLLGLEQFWSAIDAWLSGLTPKVFLALLPILRRGFSKFEAGARNQMQQLIRQLGLPGKSRQSSFDPTTDEAEVDLRRASLPIPLLLKILVA